MREFFRGWRRKTGVVTLAMACALTAGWVRSQTSTDVLDYGYLPLVASSDSRLVVVISTEAATRSDEWLLPEWRTTEYCELESEIGDNQIWTWRCAGLGIAFTCYGARVELIGFAPYWSMVIPLTLLSAYQLLSKSRPAKLPVRQKELH